MQDTAKVLAVAICVLQKAFILVGHMFRCMHKLDLGLAEIAPSADPLYHTPAGLCPLSPTGLPPLII